MPNFKGNKDLDKLGKEYLNDWLCKFDPLCLQHSKTYDISHIFLRQTGPGFLGSPCIFENIHTILLTEIKQ